MRGPAMHEVPGDGPCLWVAPHAPATVPDADRWVRPEPELQSAFAERIAQWHDGGTDASLAAAARASGWRGLHPTLPRGLVDLNRPWKGRDEAQETLFGKGALDQWSKAALRPGVPEQVEEWHRSALAQIADASTPCRGLCELHSYGDLGSSYDRAAGGRPVRRSEVSVIPSTPWNTGRPVGLAHLLPADLRGTTRGLERAVEDAVGAIGLTLGPHPYPPMSPWAISVRFLAARWFEWLGRIGELPPATAAHLARLAWVDEQNHQLEEVVTHRTAEPAELTGVGALARRIGAWTHDGARLGDRFVRESGTFTLVVELRIDLVDRSADFGEAVARAVMRYVG
jgi:hypothetical protein